MTDTTRDAREYLDRGPFDKTAFRTAYTAEFGHVPKYSAASISDLISLLEMIERDPAITDIRWIAYLLGTTFLESSTTVRVNTEHIDKRGRKSVRAKTVWTNFLPVPERGHGRTRRYGAPVKVKRLPDGTARVTEYDGEQWRVSLNGRAHPLGHGLHALGTSINPPISQSYAQDDGEENYYYGRGLVQLTWWANYADTGVMLGRGLDLLFDPELVEVPELAYLIISTGMRTGQGFAHGHTFAEYFQGSHTDYIGARIMVNPHAGAREVADFAERFERVLFASKMKPLAAGAT